MADTEKTTSSENGGALIKNEKIPTQAALKAQMEIQVDHPEYTEEELQVIRRHLTNLRTGSTAALPLICQTNACPFRAKCPFFLIEKAEHGKPCHPPGQEVLTRNHGYVPIEQLDPQQHTLVSWEKGTNCIRLGRFRKDLNFRIARKSYTGNLVTLQTKSGVRKTCTSDHICIAQFDNRAIDKFAVYLMRKGNFWRIGKVKIVSKCRNGKSIHKTTLSLLQRGNKEKADAIWVLGIYNTNAEALLAEDYFSATWQTSKACFISSVWQKKSKWDGLYKWVTQEQLDQHHTVLLKPTCFYAERLSKLGLDIRFPLWSREYQKNYSRGFDFRLTVRWPCNIRACNIIPEIMSVPVIPEEDRGCIVESSRIKKTGRFYLAGREQLATKEVGSYEGFVYSLEVKPHETYFVNSIATHNCLLEINLLNEWRRMLIDEFVIDPNSLTEMFYVNELAEIEIMLWRLNNNLAKPEHAELVVDNDLGCDGDGNVLTRRELNSYFEGRERLNARKSRIIKLMVGDRQEKWKKQAALKLADKGDPSTKTADLRSQLDRALSKISKIEQKTGLLSEDKEDLQIPEVLSPADLIGSE